MNLIHTIFKNIVKTIITINTDYYSLHIIHHLGYHDFHQICLSFATD